MESILIVDDDVNLCTALKDELLEVGYDVDYVNSGDDAFQYLTGNEVDLLLLDLKMPGKDGFDVLKQFTGNAKEQKPMADDEFERCKTQLWQRMEYLAMGLRRCGLEAVPLTTPELIELFWSIHHPDQAEIGYYPEILPELLK